MCAPGITSVAVAQEGSRIAAHINAVYILDIPRGLTARDAVDWHNAEGLYAGNGKLDTPYAANFWNWVQITDPYTGQTLLAPPSVGWLTTAAKVFDRQKPWYAVAGEVRGIITEASDVEYSRLDNDVRQSMYGNGNSVNPIMKNRGRIMIYGERTLQRAESKMTALHNVILVNYIIKNLSQIGRQYVFDPNDNVLLTQIQESFTAFLESVKADRGLEAYALTIDGSNNNATTRNLREVIVDLSVIPTDVMERLFINATVRESGATLNNVS